MTETPRWHMDTDVPHPARVYDYWLGGRRHFAIDRETAETVQRLNPAVVDTARGNRQFMVRAVRFLAEQGVRQFLDIGTGIPTSPNVHEVAGEVHPDARVVYVDNDPVVFLYAQWLMAENDTTKVVSARLQDIEAVLSEASGLLDFSQPIALMFVAVLHHLLDKEDPAGIVGHYLNALPAGSYLVLSHSTDDISQKMRANAAEAERRGTVFIPRSRAAVERMFNGRELLDPGLVLVSYWRPQGGTPEPNADQVWAYGGIARV